MNNTGAIIMSAIIACIVTAGLGFYVVPKLRELKYGQTILEIGPKWHQSKQGTPTMGGIMFIIGISVATVVTLLTVYLSGGSLTSGWIELTDSRDLVLVIAGLLLAIGCGILGYADDYIKVKSKKNQGLTPLQKTVCQLLLAFFYTLTLWISDNTTWYIPGFGFVIFKLKVWMSVVFWLLSIVIIYGCINAVNLTDGIDGLCSSTTAVVAVGFVLISYIQSYIPLGVLSAALFGGMIGFLFWNRNPAKVFMGDTGSLFIGGLVASLGFTVKCPLLLLPIGIVYVIETLSDIIQILYFKATHGKRIFKMAPIHHHFEMCGWSENKICIVFSIVNVIGVALGVFWETF